MPYMKTYVFSRKNTEAKLEAIQNNANREEENAEMSAIVVK